MSLKYRDLRMKCELFRLVDPTLAEDPCSHPDPEVEVVEKFKVKDFGEAAEHVKEWAKNHPEHTWYFRPARDRSDYGIWHDDGVCSFGFDDVNEWFNDRIVKYRIQLRELKKNKPDENAKFVETIKFHIAKQDILEKVARLRRMSRCKFIRGLLKAWIATCDWCEWYLKDMWVEKYRDRKWEREKLLYWKKTGHSATEWWSLEMHLLRDLKWNLRRLIDDGYSINTEFIRDVVIEEHGNEPGFDADEYMAKVYTGKGLKEIEDKAVKRQKETYERIIHLVDLYTFYYNQEIDDEDAFTSKKRTEDMKPIILDCAYDILDYRAMIAKGDECWDEIWDLVKKYGRQMGD